MTGNSSITKNFIFATAAIVLAFVGQFLLSAQNMLLAVVLLVVATGIFIFSMRKQLGPHVLLTSRAVFHALAGNTLNIPAKTIRAAKDPQKSGQLLGSNSISAKSIALTLRQNRLITASAALALAVTGEYLFLGSQLVAGALLTLLATLVFVFSLGQQPGPQAHLTPLSSTPQSSIQKQPWWVVLVLLASILLSVISFWLFGSDIPAIIPWLLHFASIALLIFSGLLLNKLEASDSTQSKPTSTTSKWSPLEIGIFIAILALAAFMRLYRIDHLPYGLWYDEANNGLQALRILNEPGYLPVFEESTQLPTQFLYLLAISIRLLGTTSFALRIVSVLFGIATVAVAFFTGQELFNRRLGLVLAFFLAVARWDINWSRIAMHGISVPFFEILSVGLIFRALRRQRLLDYSLAGLSLGFGLCFYPPLLLFPVVIFVFLMFAWSRRHDFLRSVWPGLLILLLGIFIASVPLSQFALHEPKSFFSRMSTTSIFSDKTTLEGWQAVGKTTVAHLLMFNYKGDLNGRHNLPGEPMLDPITGALLILGVGLSLWRIRQPGSFLLLAWLLLMLVPAIFSLDFEAPQSYRAIGSLPAAYLLAVIPLQALSQEWEQSSAHRSTTIFVIPLALVLIAAGWINYHIYFDIQSQNSDSWISFSTPDTFIGKALAELGPQADSYVSVLYFDTPTIRFLAPKITQYHPLQTYATLPIPTDGKHPMAFFIDPDRKPFFDQARLYYPNADFEELKSPSGSTFLYEIILKPSDLETAQGITASYYRSSNMEEPPFLVRKETSIAADWQAGQPAQFPFWVKWQGILYVQKYGLYQLVLHSPNPAELTLDNAQIPLSGTQIQTAQIELAQGSHELIIKSQAAAGRFELDWQPPSAELQPVPSMLLYLPPINNNGLLGKYYPNANWQAPPAFTQVDPWIHFYFHNQPLPRPYTVEWVGRINIPKAGDYHFGLESIDESELFIDDKLLVSAAVPNQYQNALISLTSGFHKIRVRYADRTGYTHINLYWAPPGSEVENVPQQVLFLP